MPVLTRGEDASFPRMGFTITRLKGVKRVNEVHWMAFKLRQDFNVEKGLAAVICRNL
jgi:hypothetical protein